MTKRRRARRMARPSQPARVSARSAKGTDEPEPNDILGTPEPSETPGEATRDFTEVSVEGADLITGTRGEKALQYFQEAANLDAIPRLSHVSTGGNSAP